MQQIVDVFEIRKQIKSKKEKDQEMRIQEMFLWMQEDNN